MAIVFDFGGVLFRWRPAALLRRLWPGRIADDAAAAQWAQRFFASREGGWPEFDRGTISAPDLVRRMAAHLGVGAHEVQAVVDAVPAELAPVPETVALLQRLRTDATAAGERLFYLSNMPAPYADHLQAAHGFLAQFDDGVFSARVRQIKPDPAIYALAAERFGLPPSELTFIDDHPPNVEAALAVGWRALHFRQADQLERALREAGHWPGAGRR